MARATSSRKVPTTSGATPKKASVKTSAAQSTAKSTAKKAPAKTVAKRASAAKSPAKNEAAPKNATAKKAAAEKAPEAAPKKAAPAKKATAKAPAPAKKAPAKAPAPKAKVTSPFDAKFLDAQRTLLGEERRRLMHDADSLTAEAYDLAQGRDPGDVQFDEESGEGDTLAVERERDLALSAQFRQQVEEIDRALLKFDDGTYGICEISGTAIPKERLKAIPWARERVEYKVGGFGRR